MHKKRTIFICVAAAVLLLALAGVLIGRYIYNNKDHAADLQQAEIAEYNAAITAAARRAGSIGEQEFVLIDTISKQAGGHTDITIRVYQLPDGARQEEYMNLRVSDLPVDFAPAYMAHGTARLLEDSLQRIVVSVAYVR